MKLLQAAEIELMDGQKVGGGLVAFLTGEQQGFIAVQSDTTPTDAKPDDIPVDLYNTADVKKIIGTVRIMRNTGGSVKYFSGYRIYE